MLKIAGGLMIKKAGYSDELVSPEVQEYLKTIPGGGAHQTNWASSAVGPLASGDRSLATGKRRSIMRPGSRYAQAAGPMTPAKSQMMQAAGGKTGILGKAWKALNRPIRLPYLGDE